MDTLAQYYVGLSATSAGNAVERATVNKYAKYVALMTTYKFIPIAVETLDPINSSALSFLVSLGKRLIKTTGDQHESSFLFQKISICLQCFNSLAFCGCFGKAMADTI